MKGKNGVCVDIFALDDCPKSVLGMELQDLWCFFLRKILYSRVGKVTGIAAAVAVGKPPARAQAPAALGLFGKRTGHLAPDHPSDVHDGCPVLPGSHLSFLGVLSLSWAGSSFPGAFSERGSPDDAG